MSHNASFVSLMNIGWLAERCCALEGRTMGVPPARLEALQRHLDDRASANSPVPAGEALDTLLTLLGMTDREHTDEPVSNMLPMVCAMPGIDSGIIYGRTEQGGWMLEAPNGVLQVSVIPPGSSFVSLRHQHDRAFMVPSFLDLFRQSVRDKVPVFVKAGIASVLINVFALFVSFYSLQVYDRVIPTGGMQTLTVLTVGVLMIMALDLTVRLSRSFIMERFVRDMDQELSHRIFHRLLQVRMDQFPSSVGSLAAQVRGYEAIRTFASTATMYTLVDLPFGVVFLLVIMAIAGPLMALVALCFFCLSILVGLLFRRRIEEHTKESAGISNRKLGVLVDALDGAETIKSSGGAWQIISAWDQLNRKVIDDEALTRRFSEASMHLTAFMQQISYILLVATGAWLASTSSLTIGGIIACAILSSRVLAPIGMLPGLIVQWGHAKIAYENIERFFTLEQDNHGVDRPLTPNRLKGEFVLQGVRFAYGENKPVLSIDRLRLAAGERVAVLGVVGSGKSTLLKTLAGLYKPTSGTVLIDGLDLHQVSRHVLTTHAGYLPQQVHLFGGSLRDNLLFGLKRLPDTAVMEACRKTGLSDLIAQHPKGLDLLISEGGAGVSDGQRQLIGVTRLMLASPRIWLLDEPTSSMDDRFEQRVMNALAQQIGAEDTLVLVTHKPALLRLVDRIVVLTPGGVALDGARDQVLNSLRNPGAAQPRPSAPTKSPS